MGMQGPSNVYTRLRRIAEMARVNSERCLTSLSHHIDVELLKEAHRLTRKDGAVGVDNQTASDYAENLEENLIDLHERFKSGRYYAPPVKRVYIDKGNGKKRPLGIPTFEDKVLQRAVKMVLEAVYEQDFLDCSYGFRPKRSVHDALGSLRENLMEMHGGWILDADIQAFFDELDHRKLREILDHRVRDGVIRRQIDKWLKAGILEGIELRYPGEGTPQGGVISPLLANIYLHEVVDTWFERDVKPRMRGPVFLVRYADDLLMGFRLESDARKVFDVLPKRVARFGLRLHPEKTKLIRYFRPARSSTNKRKDSGGATRETFDFLGFTHYWGRTRRRSWVIMLKTRKSTLQRKARVAWEWCRDHRHLPVRDQHLKLIAKLRGHYQFYGVRCNARSLKLFHKLVVRAWKFWLGRRSQKGYLAWERFMHILKRYPLLTPRMRRVT